jgi:transcriptional regulator with XRE-family HTH domain
VIKLEINDRFKLIRKHFKLTQPEMAKHIHISNGHVAMMESGKREITDRMIKGICTEFKVNELWFKNGEGNMFDSNYVPHIPLIDVLGDKIHDLSEIEKSAISEYLKLPDKHRKIIIESMRKMFK